MKRSPGFTLIELLISTFLASILTVVCISAFQQGRANIQRSESRVRMHANAQGLYNYMHRSISGLMQDCALVTSTQQSTGPGTGDVVLVFMKGKEDENDWLWQAQTTIMNSDLQWEVWHWSAATQNLSIGTSSNMHVFLIPKTFKPNQKDDYNGQWFLNLDQPRRTLSATNPWADLDNNIYFPTPGTTVSQICPGQDVGDWTDLCQNAKPVLTHVSDFSLQIVRFDGMVDTVDDTTTSTTSERDGVWLDGRIATATAVAMAPNYQSPLFFPDTSTYFQGSAITLRPRLLRVRFTVSDTLTGASQTFSFSFATPGLAGAP